MTGIYEDIEAIYLQKPTTGRELWTSSAKINSIWFRNKLPECDAHDTINLIDSEGEERFKAGNEDKFGSPAKFFEVYLPLYDLAIPELLKIIASDQKSE